MTTITALDARSAAVRAGLLRGWIETRQNLTETIYVFGHALPAVAYVAVLLLFRGKTVPGTDFALNTMVLPSLLGMTIVYGGLSAPASSITAAKTARCCAPKPPRMGCSVTSSARS
jgi:ABC-2 type transport system permease protein